MSLRKRRYYPALYSTAEQRISPLLVTVHIRSLHNHSNQVSDRLIPGGYVTANWPRVQAWPSIFSLVKQLHGIDATRCPFDRGLQ